MFYNQLQLPCVDNLIFCLRKNQITLFRDCRLHMLAGPDTFITRVGSMSNVGDIVVLQDGEARPMGSGVFVVVQDTDEGTHSVVLQRSDLEAMLALT